MSYDTNIQSDYECNNCCDLEREVRHLKEENARLAAYQFTLKDLDAAFVAGRSKTSWEQFKKDHNIKQT